MIEPQNVSLRYKQVRKVLIAVLIANLTVTVMKISLGLLSGALAVVADGFHSLVDSTSNLIGLAAIRMAERGPDEQHPYGYQRYETLGSMAIGGLLLAAAWEIGRGALNRILTGGKLEVTGLTLGLVALTFPINMVVVWLETRAGRRLNSEILLADATDTRADLWVTASVVISLAASKMGLPWLDIVVALGVVLIILRSAFDILRQSTTLLTDAMAADPDKIRALASQVPGVLFVHHIRSRGKQDAAFVDLHVKVSPEMSTNQAHAVASEVEHRLRQENPGIVDALVHIEPSQGSLQPTAWEQMAYQLRQIADGMGLGMHHLEIRNQPDGKYAAEMHLEFRGDVTLGEAHHQATLYEERIMQAISEIEQVVTHLEPLPEEMLASQEALGHALESEITSYCSQQYPDIKVIDVRLQQTGEMLHSAIRLALPYQTPLHQAHTLADDLNRQLLTRFPALGHVLVHIEPL